MVKYSVGIVILEKAINSMDSKNDYVHLIFPLVQEEDGYPGVGSERLWAKKIDNHLYEVDNIPFFVKGISAGDLVTAEEKEGALFFKELEKKSSSSTLRVILFGENDGVKKESALLLRSQLNKMGCETEGSHIPNLISVGIPQVVSLKLVTDYLENGMREGKWEYEDGAIRHWGNKVENRDSHD